jgi:hypothetical protein
MSLLDHLRALTRPGAVTVTEFSGSDPTVRPDPGKWRRGLPSSCEKCFYSPHLVCSQHLDDFEPVNVFATLGQGTYSLESHMERTFHDAFDPTWWS